MTYPQTTILLLSIFLFLNSASADTKQRIEIQISPNLSSEVDKLRATAFGISLAAWVKENENVESLALGYYVPSSEGLLAVFRSQIQIWRELQEKKKLGQPVYESISLGR